MYKKISSIILISLILASTLSNIARAEFDERFYKLNDIIYYDAGEDCAPASSGNMADINLEQMSKLLALWEVSGVNLTISNQI